MFNLTFTIKLIGDHQDLIRGESSLMHLLYFDRGIENQNC